MADHPKDRFAFGFKERNMKKSLKRQTQLSDEEDRGMERSKPPKWDFDAEQLGKCEETDWLSNLSIISKIPQDWLEVGPIKSTIDDEVEFCDGEILKGVLEGKSFFDNVSSSEVRKARTRSNPYESLGSAFFSNRAAIKMANIDAAFDFMFTSPKNSSGKPLVRRNDSLTFVDLCTEHSGFSEYVQWRLDQKCKGFAFNLKRNFNHLLMERFQPSNQSYNNRGEIFVGDNQLEFKKFVKAGTLNKGMHLVLADEGYRDQGQENIQEILSHRFYLCQFLVALSVLRDGGNFICKLFDLFTPFSVGLIFLMSHCFRRVNIFKPVTSRPANSERYFICENFIKSETSSNIYAYFRSTNQRFDSSKLENQTVRSIVPVEVLKRSEKFYDYIVKSNNFLGELQAQSLLKVKIFIQNQSLIDERQYYVKEECLKKWRITDEIKRETLANPMDRKRTYRYDTEDNLAPAYSDIAKKMMLGMGYKEGKGLGKKEQGRSEPVVASKQIGRSGLGLYSGKSSKKEDPDLNKMEKFVKDIHCKKATWMMKLMGYKEGKGLGKHEQGIVEPIKASKKNYFD